MTYLIAYICTAAIFLLIDFIWLGFVAGPYYRQELSHLIADDVKLGIAAGFYLLYAVGIVIFAVKPALDANSFQTALIYGALLGFFCYATYDMTNWATLKDWPIHIALIDMAWGTFITAFSATAGYFASKQVLSFIS